MARKAYQNNRFKIINLFLNGRVINQSIWNKLKKMSDDKIIIIKSLFIILLFLYSCSTTSENVRYVDDFSLDMSVSAIAVLDFDYSGPFTSGKIAKKMADDLTAALFLYSDILVVDRTLVKYTQKKYENYRRKNLSRQQIRNMGRDLEASHIIFGSIQSIGALEDYYEGEKKKLDMTLRIVDTQSGNIVGIVMNSTKGNEELDVLGKRLIKRMVEEMK
jgi:TolB-like protein